MDRIACLCGTYRNFNQMCLNQNCCVYMKYTQGMKERGVSYDKAITQTLAARIAPSLSLTQVVVESSLRRLRQLLRNDTASNLAEVYLIVHSLGLDNADLKLLIDNRSDL